MLILTLKEGENILIGDKITVKVAEIRGNQIRLGIGAPASVLVLREKLGSFDFSMCGRACHAVVGQAGCPMEAKDLG